MRESKIFGKVIIATLAIVFISGVFSNSLAWTWSELKSPKKNDPTYFDKKANQTERLVAGSRAPDFKIKLFHSGEATLDSYRGKVLILNFWATWCLPCRKEIPYLEEAFAQNKNAGLVILGINYLQKREKIKKFLEKTPITFPIAMDRQGEVAKAYDVLALPKSIAIDANGNIAYTHTGLLDKNTINEWFRRLAQDKRTD
ncbi:MAG TPA: TlpA disulfide reductase family protein [Nitrospinota bacterium]|nr:TlpA disulfide reductase family protein [Nitrospinota bacterium]|tara:strand:+ start:4981 stop:5580 length:600 start_codon:yes stop_codon:yes gene_type:complete